MNFIDTLKYAMESIRTRKGRSFLTTLGITIGIAAIVAMLSLGNGFQSAITNQLSSGLSTKTLTVQSGGGFGGGSSTQVVLNLNDTYLIDNVSHVVTSIGISQKSRLSIKYTENYTKSVSLSGVDISRFALIYPSFKLVNGSFPTNGTNEVVIGKSIYKPFDNDTMMFNLNDTMILTETIQNGTRVETTNYTVKVVGLLEEIGGFSLGGPSDSGIYAAQDYVISLTKTEQVNSIVVLLDSDNQDVIDQASADIKTLYNNKVSILTATALLSTVQSAFSMIELFLVAIAGISLIVAGVGIMNIMIVSLLERTREIGILKAVGATDGDILKTFLYETLLIGLMGAISGLLFGYGTAWIFALFISNSMSSSTGGTSVGPGGMGGMGGRASSILLQPILTPTLILEAIAFGLIVALVFGLYPARRAAKLHPVEALRFE